MEAQVLNTKSPLRSSPRDPAAGTVLVEGLLVISMLVLVFVGLIFVYHVHSGQARLIRASRAANMAFAQDFCEGDPIQQLPEDEVAALSGAAASDTGEGLPGTTHSREDANAHKALDGAVKKSGLALPREASVTAKANIRGPLKTRGIPGGSFSADLHTSNHVLCGEKSRETGIIGILTYAFDFFRIQ
jgi:hypothetical protein